MGQRDDDRGMGKVPWGGGEMTQLICQPACYPDEGPKYLLQNWAVLLIKPRKTKVANPTEVRFATWERQLAAVLNENETELKTRAKKENALHKVKCASWVQRHAGGGR